MCLKINVIEIQLIENYENISFNDLALFRKYWEQKSVIIISLKYKFFFLGNLANVLRYFPTQALNFAFKDSIKATFKTPKDASQVTKFSMNILSGGIAGSLSLMFVYSLDYCRTR